MYQSMTLEFPPAIFQCADCAVEHNGTRAALPAGWDKVRDPQSGHVTIRCPDCLEAIERDYASARQMMGQRILSCHVPGAIGWEMGRAAVTFRGQGA